MTEDRGLYLMLFILTLISIYCSTMYLIEVAADQTDRGCLFIILNVAAYQKMLFGITKYEKLTHKGALKPSGYKLLEYSLFRFF